ncbi:MAG TPA: tRNA preQ1(34) S-adenosylmethionine ribosyltransferase-isomerase QueA [Verrucomicrobiae bacterium]|jgi:S-adenosylmethionine:tRNA ribosyltransferase-isomerase|nr:tRNA preQ1(34) S-adenosylmethionine ribosyltransferase-isomerase QueA [Verrucomicrobiae bacterium]
MDLAQFDYDLPPSAIAQEPVTPRDASRLLVLDRARGAWHDRHFADLPDLLRAGDCLVVNESRVIPARLLGAREDDGRPVELLLVREIGPARWEALTRPGRHCRRGARIALAGGAASATVIAEGERGLRVIALEAPGGARELLACHGLPPLPPYIARHRAPTAEDRERYQTVYARAEGSVAAPTAGLHFTAALLDAVRARGAAVHALTLHVGPGTFRPVSSTTVEDHRMEGEAVEIPDETAAAVNAARAGGRRVIAVGTTTTRALEWSAAETGQVAAGRGCADLFIHPPYTFRAVDALVTNFHLPRSTLLMLVTALAGRDLVLAAYRHAVTAGYRFYSYGDAMLVV